MRLRCLVVAAALAAPACKTPTQITFTVTTDVPCAQVHGTSIAVGPVAGIDTRSPATTSTTCTGGALGSLVVIPSGASNADLAVQIVTGVGSATAEDCVNIPATLGCIVARRAIRFIPSTSLTANVVMESSCRDVVCAEGLTCLHGICAADTSVCSGTSCTAEPAAPTHFTPMHPGSAAGVVGRAGFASAWTGQKMLVYGGAIDPSLGGLANDGGIYDPLTDTWTTIPPGPLDGRLNPAAVWSGQELIVWGGADAMADLTDGAAFDPSKGRWRSIAASPAALGPRVQSGALWAAATGEMIVWSGAQYHTGALYADGAAYSPSKDTWRMLEASPLAARTQVAAIWLGDRALFYDGSLMDGAFYDPITRAWSAVFAGPIAGRDFAAFGWGGTASGLAGFWGGVDTGSRSYDDGVTFDVTTLQFRTIPAPTSVLPATLRFDSGGWATSAALWVWGGAVEDMTYDLTQVLGDGASYDFATSTWTAMPTAGAPSARHGHAVVWTGQEAIVWGGEDLAGNFLDDGAIFAP